ncbi:hypothetical protein K2Y11_20985 [bacterium]|nr:hypothetical protein [bacterium]
MNKSASLERIRNRRLVYLLGFILGFLFLFFGAWYCLEMSINDAYAQWGAADLVIQYMEEHGGKWPSNWDVLRQSYETKGGRVSGWSFGDFKSRMFIDFSVNSNDLEKQSVKSNKVPFDVIHARSPLSSMMGEGPNAQLYHYFRHKAGMVDSPRPVDNNGPVTVPIPRSPQ